MRYIFLILCFFSLNSRLFAQQLPHPDSVKMLIANTAIQLECTGAMNDLYNFKFKRAESIFHWLERSYPEHPLGYFLMGLSQWWKIVPNVDNKRYDKSLLAYMDTTILLSKVRLKSAKKETRIEAAFFLSLAYGFRGRIFSERKKWTAAATAGKKSLKYIELASEKSELSPEFLLGDGLYNYYSVWIPENYKYLRPLLWFFKKGDKDLGLKQLQEVSTHAFYTRTEAQFFLMRLYANEPKQGENRVAKSLAIAENLHNKYPDNAYFHRYYARALYIKGRRTKELEKVCLTILENIDDKKIGYEAVSGRYATFYLGYIYKNQLKNEEKAIKYLEMCLKYSEKLKAYTAGYYLYSLLYLAEIADLNKQYSQADYYYRRITDTRQKKHSTYKKAKIYLKKNRKRK